MFFPLRKHILIAWALASPLTGKAQDAVYGLHQMLGTSSVEWVDSIAPADPVLMEPELETRSSPSATAARASTPSTESRPIDWKAVHEELDSHSSEKKKQEQAEIKTLKPKGPRERLLMSVGSLSDSPNVSERIAPTVSDLGAFRARALATDVYVPPPAVVVPPHEYPRHDSSFGRSVSPNEEGYAQP